MRHAPGTTTVTTEDGLDTFYSLLNAFPTPVVKADQLLRLVERGTEVSAGPDGYVLAEMTCVDGEIVMTRRDEDDRLSTHRLDLASVDAARLCEHWKGFCQAALRDHEARLAASRVPGPGR